MCNEPSKLLLLLTLVYELCGLMFLSFSKLLQIFDLTRTFPLRTVFTILTCFALFVVSLSVPLFFLSNLKTYCMDRKP